jgi:hypothetical protein
MSRCDEGSIFAQWVPHVVPALTRGVEPPHVLNN